MKVFLCLVSLFIAYFLTRPYEGECIKVLDGDTVIFKRYGKEERVRLLYIDTPEERQGKAAFLATQYLRKRIEGKRVRLKERGIDIYGRTLAVIYLENENINFSMVENGYAFLYRFQKFKNGRYKRQYIEAYERAKTRLLGIFKLPEILEPYHFRRSIKQ